MSYLRKKENELIESEIMLNRGLFVFVNIFAAALALIVLKLIF